MPQAPALADMTDDELLLAWGRTASLDARRFGMTKSEGERRSQIEAEIDRRQLHAPLPA